MLHFLIQLQVCLYNVNCCMCFLPVEMRTSHSVSIMCTIFAVSFGSKGLLYKMLCLVLITCLSGLCIVPIKPQRFHQYIYDACFPVFFACTTTGPRSEPLCRGKQWENMNPCHNPHVRTKAGAHHMGTTLISQHNGMRKHQSHSTHHNGLTWKSSGPGEHRKIWIWTK